MEHAKCPERNLKWEAEAMADTQVSVWGGQAKRMTDGGGLRKIEDQIELWQTPATDSFRSRGGDRKDEMGLDQQARLLWPTVRSHEVGEYQNQTDGSTQPTLTGSAQQWPTPAHRDYRSPGLRPYSERGGADEGRESGELCGALFPPGPADEQWGKLLAIHPELEPARSSFDWLCDGLRSADVLPVGAAGVVASGSHRRVAILRDRERGRLVGRYIGAAIGRERHGAQTAQTVGLSPADDQMGKSVQVDAAGVPAPPQRAIRGVIDELSARLDERADRLRALGNAVLPVQGAAALIELARRFGLNV